MDGVQRRTQREFDDEFVYQPPRSDPIPKLKKKLRRDCRCSSGEWWWEKIRSFLPILEWLPKYNPKTDLAADIVAGLTVGIMHIPQGMAYAGLAGLEPVYGLFTSFFPSIFYMFFGTSRHVSLGVFAVVSLMVGSVRYRLIPEDKLTDLWATVDHSNETFVWDGPVNFSDSTTTPDPSGTTEAPLLLDPTITPIVLVSALTFLVGIIQLLMGVLRLGFVSSYLSDQVVSGFTTGAAVHVLVAQINKLVGVRLPRHSGFGKLPRVLVELAVQLPNSSIPTVIISVVCIISLAFCKEVFTPRLKKLLPLPVPFELILVILATAISHFTGFEYIYGVKVVEDIPTGIPPPKLPNFSLLSVLLMDAIGIAIVVFAVTISMGKLFAKKYGYSVDANQESLGLGLVQLLSSLWPCHVASMSLARSCVLDELGIASQELYALGAMQMLSSCFPIYPAGTALARSLVYEQAGVRTQLATVFSSLLLLVVLLWIGPLFHALPMCVLSSIIVVALKGMFMQFREVPLLWRRSKIDLSIWLVSFIGVVLADVREGLLIGIGYAIITVVVRTQRPGRALMGRVGDTDLFRDVKRYVQTREQNGVKVFRFQSPLMFTNAEFFRTSLLDVCGVNVTEAKKWKKKAQKTAEVTVEEIEEKNPLSTPESSRTPPGCPHAIILDCGGISYIDIMGSNTIKEIYLELESIGIQLLFADCRGQTREMLESCLLFEKTNIQHWFLTVNDALEASSQLILENGQQSFEA